MKPAPPNDAFPVVYQQDRFLSAPDASVSVFDRGIHYGDGVFESLRICDGQPQHWNLHFERLQRGAQFLDIPLDRSSTDLRQAAVRLAELNRTPDAMLRVTLTRGVGPRGYSTAGLTGSTLLMTLHHAPPVDPHSPPQCRVITSTVTVGADDPLTRLKTCNRLPYILARKEADAASVDDALIQNTRGEVVETSGANVFWLLCGALGTAPTNSGALPGVTRAIVLRLAHDLGLPTPEVAISPSALLHADAVFLTTSSVGLIEVVSLDGHSLNRSPLIRSLHEAYWALAGRNTEFFSAKPGSTEVDPFHIPGEASPRTG